jgi:O-antigen/teichoic acid export membrane protein
MISDDGKLNEAVKNVTSDTVNSRPKGALTNAGWNSFSPLISGVISFILTPLLIHYLGVSQYGILLLIWSVTGILCLADFGLGEATLRYVAYHYGDGDISGVNRVLGSTLSFFAVISAVISTVLFVAAPTFVGFMKIPTGEHQLVSWLLRLSALVFSLTLITRVFGAIPMALQRYDISSKVSIGQSVVRSIGYVLLVVSKFGILALVMWDVATSLGMIFVNVAVIRKLSPGVRLFPSFSLRGLREIIGYSIYSFLTYIFYMLFRESGKLVLGRYLGPSAVAYLGTPDNLTQRVHMLVASGSETLLPRFSANRDPKVDCNLFLNGTWAALAFSIVFFVPIVVLMPDFLSLWISPNFSLESAAVGQVLAISYITQGAFAPAATFFRGSGKPWVVSIVMFFAGVGTLLLGVILVQTHGVIGAGYAFLIGSMAHFLGLLCGWFYLFGKSSTASLLRSVGMPLLMGGVAFILEIVIRARFAEVNWFGLIVLGGLFAGITALLVLCVDWVLGGDPPSKQFFERIRESDKLRELISHIPGRQIR